MSSLVKRLHLLAILSFVAIASACNGNSDSESNELRPAGEVVEEKARGELLEPGDATRVDDIEIIADNFVFEKYIDDDGTGNEKQIRVFIRAENRSNDEKTVPLALVFCSNGTDGSWYVSSTLTVYDVFPSNTFVEGDLILGVPPNCDDPVLRVDDPDASQSWRIPESALTK